MRAAFLLSFLANLLLALVPWLVLPDCVAVHFGPGGAPDGWASRQSNTLMMLGMHGVVLCSLYFSPRILVRVPRKWISLPNADYWLQPERRSQTVARFSEQMWRFVTALFLFLLFIRSLILRANLSDPVRLDERLFLIRVSLGSGKAFVPPSPGGP
jgi:uncharacterized membrane protein